jgi:GTPase involved in cell partitioning and DNA repair
MPYSQRPEELPLDVEECRTAIWYCRGNITQAAAILKVPSARLRNFVNKSQYLSREVEEATEQLIDRAEVIVSEALDDEEDKSRQDQMAKFVLSSTKARKRGWGAGSTPSLSVKNTGSGTMVVGWADGTQFKPVESSRETQTIEGEIVENDS